MRAAGFEDRPSGEAMPEGLPVGVFVYGTLKRGGLRSRLWPIPPNDVLLGRLRGCQLLDLGPYPGLIVGAASAVGELWLFDPPQLAETLRCLDQVEGCAPHDDPPLYERRVCSIELATGRRLNAWSYWWLGRPGRPIPSWSEWQGEPSAAWPDGLSAPPSRLTDDSLDSDL
jgi:gamma-glutamylcyclotransferase (GGCT)/AIG2-like uncharacterized protein YtfP